MVRLVGVLGICVWGLACNDTAEPALAAAGRGGGVASIVPGAGGVAGALSNGGAAPASGGAPNHGGGEADHVAGAAGQAGSNAGSGTAGSSMGSPGGAASAGASGQAFAGSGTAGTQGDAGSSAAGAPPCAEPTIPYDPRCIPPEQPSKQTVYFDITNDKSTEVYLVTSGRDCTAYEVQATGEAAALVLATFTPSDCPCGVACDSNTRAGIERLDPGATRTLTWDGRHYDGYFITKPDPCDATGEGTIGETVFVASPAAPEPYTVTVGWYLPPPCEYCGEQPTYAFAVPPRCASDDSQTVGFELMPTGDLHVPISIR